MNLRQTLLRNLAAAVSLILLQMPASAQDTPKVRDVGGRYEVEGTTLNQATGERRKISGIIRISQTGDTFRSHSELQTLAPGEHARHARVIGTGAGTIVGDHLSGTGELQLITSKVPGLDTDFGMAPTATSSRAVHTTWEATVAADGLIRVETLNVAGKGETDYQATHTSLKGKRVAKRKP